MKNGSSVIKFLGMIFFPLGIALFILGLVIMFAVWGVGGGLAFCGLGSVGAIFALVGGIFLLCDRASVKKKEELLAAGKYVLADVVDIDVNVNQEICVDRISMNPYYIVCRYVDAKGEEYFFKSKNLLYNPSGLIRNDQLKVYVDLADPKKYYVDTNAILPENAILHKFKYDSSKNAEKLMQEGNYIMAQTCGVELIGRIKVTGMTPPKFLRLPNHVARQFRMGVDEKGRAFVGYTVLCRYDAADGVTHIFASKGFFGEPERAFMGDTVRVYYSGNDFNRYHVDIT